MADISTEKLTEFWGDLRRLVGGEVKTDAYSRTLYSTDASIYRMTPFGVFFPETTDEIQAAVETAARYQVPILMRGAGSSLAGQCVNKALVIDVSRHLNRVIEVNAAEKWVRVQPGLVLDTLNNHLKPHGLQFGPDPASSNRATMGGIVANNSTGSHSILYGMTADHVLEAATILSDGSKAQFGAVGLDQLSLYQEKDGFEGEIYRNLMGVIARNEAAILQGTPRHWRRCGGYNLDRLTRTDVFNIARLICGSEGTLAALTELKLNLVDRPQFTSMGIIHFDDMRASLEASPLLLETNPSAIELMDKMGLTMCRQVPEYARLLTFIEGDPRAILVVEYDGSSEAEVQGKLDNLMKFLAHHKIGTICVRADTPRQQANVWGVRKVSLGLLMSIKGDYKPIPFIEDSAVPVEHLANYIGQIEDFCHSLDTRVTYYAHASAGCLHVRPLIDLKQAEEADKMVTIATKAAELVADYGGALSSEHGDGRARSWLNERFFGPDLYRAYQETKAVFDPHNLLNPNNIVDSWPMTENLRYGASYSVIPVKEHIDFSHDQGFHRAVEMCNGAGVCRKEGGTMCPSYMATHDEEHSTRGRANLLRAALSGALPPTEFTGHRMYEALDLCIECKACKAECPSSVDMAKIKFEFLANYYEVNPVPLPIRFFANINFFNRLTSGPLAPIANWSLQNPVIRWALEKFMGIDRRRSLPEFAPVPFTTWFKNRPQRAAGDNQKQVVLFNDTFNTYNYPETAIAATEVLEAAGYTVILPGHRCCGRPMISKGLVDQAKAAAAETVAKLAPYANRRIPIVGLEPSCISALRDDYLSLLPGSVEAKMVADMTVSFEEFMASLADDPDFALPLHSEAQQILLHGHCHQKALIGTAPAKKTLGLLKDCTVSEVDSGCCGMAGAFGYETEHYDVSLTMAERKLLPAVRQADEATVIVAAGVSCRQQIKHGTGRKAYHPAQVLQQALNGKEPH